MKRWNKASIAAISSAVVSALAVVFGLTNEMQGALTTVFTTIGVWAIPNKV